MTAELTESELITLLRDIISTMAEADGAKKAKDTLMFAIEKADEGKTLKSRIAVAMHTSMMLYRHGYMERLGQMPTNFIRDFAAILISDSGDEKSNIRAERIVNQALQDDAVRGHLGSVAHPPTKDIQYVLWPAIINMDGKAVKTDVNLQPFYESQADLIGADYQSFHLMVETSVQNSFGRPDLVLVDSIKLEEYRAKGVFDIWQHFAPPDIGKAPELRLGKTVNGTIVGAPLTRNFHVPAMPKVFAPQDEFKRKTEHVKRFELIKDNLSQSWAPEPANPTLLDLLTAFFQGSASIARDPLKEYLGVCVGSEDHKPEECRRLAAIQMQPSPELDGVEAVPFALNMGESLPFIPMQAGRGAHVVYTFLAYVGVFNDKSPGLIQAKQGTQGGTTLSMYKPSLYKSRVVRFMETVTQYVPVVSLALDHMGAAALRGCSPWDKWWFDPCWPIEAIGFNSPGGSVPDIVVGKKATHVDNSNMGCLGGYCLAMVHGGLWPYEAAKAAIEIGTELFNAGKMPVGSASNDFPTNNLLVTWEEEAGSIEEGYIPLPDPIATRPQFSGWPLLEERLSFIVRTHMAAVMVVRSIAAEWTFLAHWKKKENVTRGDMTDQFKIVSVYSLIAAAATNEDGKLSKEKLRRVSPPHPEDAFDETPDNFLDNIAEGSSNYKIKEGEIDSIEQALYVDLDGNAVRKYFERVKDNIESVKDAKNLSLDTSGLEGIIQDSDLIAAIIRSKAAETDFGELESHTKFIESIAHRLTDSIFYAVEDLAKAHNWGFEELS